jgi:hypothetical protein
MLGGSNNKLVALIGVIFMVISTSYLTSSHAVHGTHGHGVGQILYQSLATHTLQSNEQWTGHGQTQDILLFPMQGMAPTRSVE